MFLLDKLGTRRIVKYIVELLQNGRLIQQMDKYCENYTQELCNDLNREIELLKFWQKATE